jgi:hypothetical protein
MGKDFLYLSLDPWHCPLKPGRMPYSLYGTPSAQGHQRALLEDYALEGIQRGKQASVSRISVEPLLSHHK